ncbi:hypothetical protein ACQ5SK_12645 [Bradyrhizobium japonicum]
MIHISRVDLTERGILLPHDRVGMVIAQPHLTLTQQEPYRTPPAGRPELLGNLTATLAVSRAAPHQAEKTHFTIFPEYSIPGLEGVELIDAALADARWPAGTIVIGGVDALSKADFASLAGRVGSHFDTEHNGLDNIGAGEWINCAIIWTKAENGTVERWLQPKALASLARADHLLSKHVPGQIDLFLQGNFVQWPEVPFFLADLFRLDRHDRHQAVVAMGPR